MAAMSAGGSPWMAPKPLPKRESRALFLRGVYRKALRATVEARYLHALAVLKSRLMRD